jgi:hypothetical protein
VEISIGAIATGVGVPVVIAAVGYGGRWLQDLRTDRNARDDRQRAIAGQAQEQLAGGLDAVGTPASSKMCHASCHVEPGAVTRITLRAGH